jgi:predicted transcriptional regulator
MKSVLISIQPKWCELIASGRKTVEVRKTKLKLDTPFKCYIYCTKGDPLMKTAGNKFFIDNGYRDGENLYGLYELANGKVIGEFVCDRIVEFENSLFDEALRETVERSCVPMYDLLVYLGKQDYGYGWHISDLVIYDEPKPLSNFHHCGVNYHFNPPITRPPQSWCYVTER